MGNTTHAGLPGSILGIGGAELAIGRASEHAPFAPSNRYDAENSSSTDTPAAEE
jgi:hypothetical protein